MRKSRLAVVIVAACLVATAVTAAWAAGRSKHRAGTAKTEVTTPTVPGLELKWTHRFKIPYRLYLSGATLYATSDEVLSAFDVATGRTKWRALLDGSPQSDPLQIGDTVALLVGDDDQTMASLTGFSAASGKQLWTVAAKAGCWTSGLPLASKGATIYFEDRDGNLYAVDSQAGKLEWSRPTTRDRNMGDFPIVAGDSVVWSDGNLSAVEAKTGTVRWTYKCAPGYTDLVGATPHTAFLSTTGGAEDFSDTFDPSTLRGIDLRTGTPRWDLPVRSAFGFVNSVCAVSNGIMVTCEGKRLVARDLETGREAWTDESDLWPAGRSVRTDGMTVCFATAPLQESTPVGPEGEPEIAVADNGAPVALRALDLRTGKLLWQRRGTGLTYPVAVRGGLAFIHDTGISLLILDARSGEPKWETRCIDPAPLTDGSIFFGQDMLLYLENNGIRAVSMPGLRPTPPGDQTGPGSSIEFLRSR